jgi:hypothetical protein
MGTLSVVRIALVLEDVPMGTIAISAADLRPETGTCPAELRRLVCRARKGERPAFLALFRTHSRRIYALTLRLAGDVTGAENLTRDIFLEAFRNLDAVCSDEAFATLLYRRAAKTMIARRFGAEASVPQGACVGQES